jgi:hypothetical protein
VVQAVVSFLVRIFYRFLVCPKPCRQVSTTKIAPLGCHSSPSKGSDLGTASIRLPSHPRLLAFGRLPGVIMSFNIFPACQHKCTPIVTFTLGKLRSRNCGFLSGPKALTLVAYLNSSPYYYVVLLVVLIPIQALMPMPYYIFPTPSQNLRQKRRRDVCALRLSSTPVVCGTALCALGRGPVASSQTQRPLRPDLCPCLRT